MVWEKNGQIYSLLCVVYPMLEVYIMYIHMRVVLKKVRGGSENKHN